MVAHHLEKAAVQNSEEKIWMNEYLVFIHDIVTKEVYDLYYLNERLMIHFQKIMYVSFIVYQTYRTIILPSSLIYVLQYANIVTFTSFSCKHLKFG
jgi:hypothetical protein